MVWGGPSSESLCPARGGSSFKKGQGAEGFREKVSASLPHFWLAPEPPQAHPAEGLSEVECARGEVGVPVMPFQVELYTYLNYTVFFRLFHDFLLKIA